MKNSAVLKSRKLIRPSRRIYRSAKFVNAAAAAVAAVIVIVIVNLVFNVSGAKKYISPEDVAAFHIPQDSLTSLWDLSQKYGIDFTELLTVYAIDNDFFPDRAAVAPTPAEIEKKYILNYDEIKSNYTEENYGEYYKLIGGVFFENGVFPIPQGFTEDSFMYGDSFGTEKYGGEKTAYYGTDIIDRENISGRIPVTTVADGSIEEIGWNESDGYHVGVRSAFGVYYSYANLDGITAGLEKGDSVAAGQLIGKMGATARAKKEGAVSNHPVHLQIKIKAETALSDGDFWFNPYPVLRLIAYKTKTDALRQRRASEKPPVLASLSVRK